VSPSDQNLPPDLKQLIETIMRFLRQKDWHPKLLLTPNDYDSILDPPREAKLNADGLIAKFHPQDSRNGESEMFKPNLYTLRDGGNAYGLHQFKDGDPVLAKQHTSGDWQALRRAKESEVQYFKKHGEDESRPCTLGPI
jgi:hypothetical protein